MATLFGMFPFLKTLFADGGYQGPQFANALAKFLPHLDVEIVKRSDRVGGFAALPKRWIVERSIAWLNRCRRLAKDWEESQPKGARFLTPRLNPPHAQKTLQSGLKFPDRLLHPKRTPTSPFHSALTDCTVHPMGMLPKLPVEATVVPFMNQIAVLPLGVTPQQIALAVTVVVADQ